MAKKIITVILILVISSGIYLASINKEKNSLPPSPIPTPVVFNPVHPYAISHLNSRVNTDNKLQIEKNVSLPRTTYESFFVSYNSEGLKQHALMHVPRGVVPSLGWPVIIVNHGYIPPKSYSTIESYKNTSAYYASNGFVVIKPDYRGHDTSEGEISMPISRSQYAVDVLNLVEAIDTLEKVNPDKIFLYGHSMGGEVSLQVAQSSPKIKGVVLWAPAVTSYPQSVSYFLSRRRPTPTAYPTLLNEISNIVAQYGTDQLSSFSNLSLVNVPIIIHHATADESVPYKWGQELADKLITEGKSVTFYTYSNDNHDIALHWGQALARDVDFFKSLL